MSKVLHLPLNEDNGDARDFSGNDNNGTVNGATQGVGGIRGAKCYDFDGTDDWIEVADNDKLDFGTGDFSISFWLKTSNTSEQQAYITKRGVCGLGSAFSIRDNGTDINSLDFSCIDGSSSDAVNIASGYKDGNWHMITCVRGEQQEIYLDGVLQDSSSHNNRNVTNSTSLKIGNSPCIGDDNTEYPIANIQDVRIYDHALTPLEIQELYKQGSPVTPRLEKGSVDVTSGLVSRYTMDDTEVSGSTLTDVAGSNDGTISGATTGLQGVDGGQSFDFDGTNDYIDIGPIFGDNTDTLYISMWVNFDVLDNNNLFDTLFTYDATDFGNDSQAGWFDTDQVWAWEIRKDSSTDSLRISDTAPSTNSWTHVVYFADTNNQVAGVYVNGSLVGTQSIGSSSLDTSGNFWLAYDGNTYGEGDYLDGQIDEVRIYDRALSQSEVNTLYQNFDPYSKSRAPTDPNIVSSGGVARYSMDDADVSGSTLTDTFGTNDGTINGATTGVSGIGGGEAFDFDGVDDDITLPNENTFDYSNLGPFTVSGWVKGTAFNNGALVDKRLAGSFNGWTIRLRDDGRVQIVIHDGTSQALTESDTNINDNKWHHIVAIFDKGNTYGLRMYIDGVEPSYNQQQFPTSIGNIDNGLNVRIGNFQDGSNYFDGQIDEIRIYDRVLTETEVWTLYQQGKRLLPELVEAR